MSEPQITQKEVDQLRELIENIQSILINNDLSANLWLSALADVFMDAVVVLGWSEDDFISKMKIVYHIKKLSVGHENNQVH